MSEKGRFDFSLIVATLGRTHELNALMESLREQTLGSLFFEIILVDQNCDDRLVPIVAQHRSALTIRHVRSSRLGSSHNRNLGIGLANGRWITFPDDDCTYYPNTLQSAREVLLSNPEIDMVFGAIVDRVTSERIIRNWPLREIVMTERNYFFLYSQITLFAKPSALRFDERMGPATAYPAYEDADFVYSAIQSGLSLLYSPCIELWHPRQGVGHMSEAKAAAYSLGFGAFVVKHANTHTAGLFLRSVIYHASKMFLDALLGRWQQARVRWVTLKGRFLGAWRFHRQNSKGGE